MAIVDRMLKLIPLNTDDSKLSHALTTVVNAQLKDVKENKPDKNAFHWYINYSNLAGNFEYEF